MFKREIHRFRLVAAGALLCSGLVWGQVSNGSDGAFAITTADARVVNGIFEFDPIRDNLDADGDNVYHFTTIDIGAGVTVRLRASRMRHTGPVVWLASGDVTITGKLVLDGANGHPGTNDLSLRVPSEPGPGGYPGGVGAKPGDVPQRGAGPGGGVAPTSGYGCSAGHVATASMVTGRCAGGGASYGTSLIQPLIGGSGGSGGSASGQTIGGGGGAGGGAIRLRSATKIVIPWIGGNMDDGIYASGGTGDSYAGNGSGGAIHLQAPVVQNSGTLRATGIYTGGNLNEGSGHGRIRIDTDNLVANNSCSPPPLSGPFAGVDVALPATPRVRVVSVGGQAVPAQPNAGYTVPDVSIDSTSAVPIVIETRSIPAGTIVKLYVSTDVGGADAVVDSPAIPAGDPATVTVNVTLPQGVSRIFVRAIW